ncbi:hypothetical protein BC567DRAFT_230547 [Phyllosticta citribraziliensis]
MRSNQRQRGAKAVTAQRSGEGSDEKQGAKRTMKRGTGVDLGRHLGDGNSERTNGLDRRVWDAGDVLSARTAEVAEGRFRQTKG